MGKLEMENKRQGKFSAKKGVCDTEPWPVAVAKDSADVPIQDVKIPDKKALDVPALLHTRGESFISSTSTEALDIPPAPEFVPALLQKVEPQGYPPHDSDVGLKEVTTVEGGEVHVVPHYDYLPGIFGFLLERVLLYSYGFIGPRGYHCLVLGLRMYIRPVANNEIRYQAVRSVRTISKLMGLQVRRECQETTAGEAMPARCLPQREKRFLHVDVLPSTSSELQAGDFNRALGPFKTEAFAAHLNIVSPSRNVIDYEMFGYSVLEKNQHHISFPYCEASGLLVISERRI